MRKPKENKITWVYVIKKKEKSCFFYILKNITESNVHHSYSNVGNNII